MDIYQKEKELVLARLEVLSPELHFSVGAGMNSESFSRNEMIAQVTDGTKIGKEFIKVDLDFLRALKDGTLMKSIATM